ncbi:MAG: aspartate racemase [Idiomarinaceae bacterium HL-53]|nr:MAG: aspartate racemase [Idiomarinaceae bacterium HL-53]CUS48704.1 aspartate racemase [Idiomarinaceae bacterium HL-53]
MKRIGLIGGMSWESTAVYYRLLNQSARARLGGQNCAPLVLWNVDFAKISALQHSGDWQATAALLIEGAERLERAGAECILICTNTMHKVAEEVQARVQIPLLHLIDIVAHEILARGMKRVGLLGTQFTMSESFYAERLASHGIDTMVPSTSSQAEIHRVIYEELCQGECSKKSKQFYLNEVEKLSARGAQGIILGCTEIGLLISQENTPIPLLDTTALHVNAALDFVLTDA